MAGLCQFTDHESFSDVDVTVWGRKRCEVCLTLMADFANKLVALFLVFWKVVPLITGRFLASRKLEVFVQPDSSQLSCLNHS